jgi:3-methylcrotonyl-CoA carboxylase alpha subunit
LFQKILIANRAEIACRIIRTAKRMGIATVAVYSDADAHAPHVRLADDAIRLGPAPAKDSYLRSDLILAAAKVSGTQAIHPGYGFLSENADFAEQCAAAGISFIGPKPDAIRAMGLKDRAKAIAVEAGAPVLPGYWQADQSEAVLHEAALGIGFPLLVKAVAGGGGRGIRRVDTVDELATAVAAARREAAGAFGDDRVMLEKLVLNPRHIEVQVFGDSHGNVVHLFERDCSIQRRRQKLIEEAPAPGVSPDVRAHLMAAAIKIAKAVQYQNAGTVEFVADGTGPLTPEGFWFLEMNTRLQVEHPVTEAITGLDLVEWQFRVAAGEKLPLTQEQITLNGWAIEARIVAEDPAKGFLPSSGLIEQFDIAGAGLRLDAGFGPGDVVPDAYDSLLAKAICHGATRTDAVGCLADVLERAVVVGPAVNAGFLARVLRHPVFAAGTADTGFLEAYAEDVATPVIDDPRRIALAALAHWQVADAKPSASPSPWHKIDGWRLNAPAKRTIWFEISNKERAATLVANDESYAVSMGGVTSVFQRSAVSLISADVVSVFDGRRAILAKVSTAGVDVFDRGERFTYWYPKPGAHADEAEASDAVLAPLPGKVALIHVCLGQTVTKGMALAVLEAMKMEHTLSATRDGVIGEVRVSPGAQVKAGEVLIKLETVDEGKVA